MYSVIDVINGICGGLVLGAAIYNIGIKKYGWAIFDLILCVLNILAAFDIIF